MERTPGEDLRASETPAAKASKLRARWLHALALASSLWAGAASADTISVDTAADNDVGCTLRNAVRSANDDWSYGGCTEGRGGDVIDLSAIAGQTITLAQGVGFGELVIDGRVTIEGAGVTIDGGGASRIFRIQSDAVIRNVTLMNGFTEGNGGAVAVNFGTTEIQSSTLRNSVSDLGGGAIAVFGSLILRDSVLFDNSSTDNGGAILGGGGADIRLANTTVAYNSAIEGGGLYTDGTTLELTHSTLIGNEASTGGALASRNDTVTIIHSILANSIGGEDCFADTSTIFFTGVSLIRSQSTCSLSGFDLIAVDPSLGPLADNGGPTLSFLPQELSPVIDLGSPLSGCPGDDQRGFPRFDLNHDLGSIEVQDVDRPVQAGPDFIVNSADDTDDGTCRQFPGHCSLREALNAANANADASTISCPAATITLAGVQLPSVTTEVSVEGGGVTLDGNHQSRLFSVGNGGTLMLDQLTLTNGFDAVGGGAVDVGNGGALVLRNSTVANSQAAFGGAVRASVGSVQLVNSTLTGNTASNAGGGIWADTSTVEIVQGTISGNTSPDGAIVMSGGSATLTNSILANSIGGPDCRDGGGSYTLTGVNLVEDQGDCGLPAGPDLIEGTDPALEPLGDNGGPTATLLPMLGSPVLNVGDNAQVSESHDQRGVGFPRIFGPAVDLGATELQANPQIGADFVVNVSDDVERGVCNIAPDSCSLRDALNAANANADASTITFDASLLNPAATITLTGAPLPAVTTEVRIQGGGITVDGDQLFRLFSVGSGGTLTLNQLTLTNGFDAVGGGAVDVGNGGALVLRNSTVANSQAASGGAVRASVGSVQLVNSSLTGNTASIAGGGIWADTSTVEIVQGTISGNTSPYGAIVMIGGSATLTNSILANSIGGADCQDGGGSYTLTGVNLVEDQGDCGLPAGPKAEPTLIEGTDPALGPLADNGGPTPTFRPLPGSPVIDAGDALANPANLDFDQRGVGFLRLRDANVDLGAVEVQFAGPDVIFLNGYESPPNSP